MVKKIRSGRSLEQLVSIIERSLSKSDNATIQSPAMLPDRVTGEDREHDVLITFKHSYHQIKIAIECRDRSRRITVNDVEGFISKCHDTLIDQGIIVSSQGFTKSAIKKAAHNSIKILRLSQISSFDWLLIDSIKTTVRNIISCNFTFIPDADPQPQITKFSVLSSEGDVVSEQFLTAVCNEEFSRLSQDQTPLKKGSVRIKFLWQDVFLRDDSTGISYPVTSVFADINYEKIEGSVPLTLFNYTNEADQQVITNMAMAKMNMGGLNGNLVIRYKSDEGGEVFFVPEKQHI